MESSTNIKRRLSSSSLTKQSLNFDAAKNRRTVLTKQILTNKILIRGMFILTAVFFSAVLLTGVPAQPARSSETVKEDRSSISGTVTLEINTPSGNARIILPDDMRSGDVISGTVTGAQGGEVIEVKTVEGEVVATKKMTSSANGGSFTFTVPQGSSSLQLMMTAGKHIDKVQFSINSAAGDNASLPSGNFAPPRLGQTGRSITIPGNFDGSAGNTSVGLGGKEIPVLAESPRQTVVKIPADTPTGKNDLTIKDGNGNAQSAPFNVVAIELKADKLNLMRGEKTNLHVSITGLEGLKDNSGNIKLQIENASPQTVSLTNPAYQSNNNAGAMPARTVNPDGSNTITFTEQLIGVNPGNFQINASIMEWIGKAVREALRVAANNKSRKQLRELADMKDSAANAVVGNSKAARDLKENAKFLRGKADDDKLWDGKGGDDVDMKKLLEDEKKKLEHTKTSLSSSNGNAIGKIGAALDAIDKMLR